MNEQPSYRDLVIDIVCTHVQGDRLRGIQEHPATEHLIDFAEQQGLPASAVAHYLVDQATA